MPGADLIGVQSVMANIIINVPSSQLQNLLDDLVTKDILTDYHGSYPLRLVIELRWIPDDDGSPKPVATGVQIGFA